MTSIDFSELIPERLRVNNLPDGSSLELINRNELGPEELAAVHSVQKRMASLQEELDDVDELDDEMLAAMNKMNDLSGEILLTLAPDMKPDTLASLKMGQRGAIIQWWTSQQPASGENGNAAPKAGARRSRSSKQRG